MGLFDDALKNSVPGGNLTKPLIIAAGALILGKMLTSHSSAPAAAPAAPTPQDNSPSEGGLLGGLGGLLGRLQQAGHSETANSWVGTGQNQPIDPGHLGNALGQQTVSDLARQAGVSEDDLLAQLSKALPGLVNNLTPNGRLPTQDELIPGPR